MAVAVNSTGAADQTIWLRGQITGMTQGRGIVSVYLVDHGSTVTVPWADLRRLQPGFLTLECQAILVKLADVAPLNKEAGWDVTASQFLENFGKNQQTLRMVVYKTTVPATVVLFESFPAMDFCINAGLVGSGLALSTGKL